MSTLKPCPFCGGNGRLYVLGPHVFVKCERCRVETDWLVLNDEADAIAAWNQRAPSDEITRLRAELAAAREAFEVFVETMDMWAGDNSDRADDGVWRAIKTARTALGDSA